jgi:hypothetical protein
MKSKEQGKAQSKEQGNTKGQEKQVKKQDTQGDTAQQGGVCATESTSEVLAPHSDEAERVAQLRALFPECVGKGGMIDAEKLARGIVREGVV